MICCRKSCEEEAIDESVEMVPLQDQQLSDEKREISTYRVLVDLEAQLETNQVGI